MTKFRLSTAARAALTAFIADHDGAHVPSAAHVERAISDSLSGASGEDVYGARISYRSAGPTSMSYRYAVRGLTATFVVRRRVIDLISAEIEKIYPKNRERVQVVRRLDEPTLIRTGHIGQELAA
ncbi:hypothetical protein HOY34_21335 [Xinfangfangia sp. D13-10-4-6]|uniref:hypothetical protein n=1 Tax=Pseudogemmobacter hezensis TaxID=2737662 RepID=UPI0015580796|nr:hypothetical protein [Pseudogemmobacter hezensis]NPD17726.1 hypothetical protein [Pseudogemmobacter hezensis]